MTRSASSSPSVHTIGRRAQKQSSRRVRKAKRVSRCSTCVDIVQSASSSHPPRSAYGTHVSLNRTLRSSRSSRAASSRASCVARRAWVISLAPMNTSFACGRLSLRRAIARTALGASSQFQMPPFHSTSSASAPTPSSSSRGPGPSGRGGSSGTPNGTTSRRDRSVGSAS